MTIYLLNSKNSRVVNRDIFISYYSFYLLSKLALCAVRNREMHAPVLTFLCLSLNVNAKSFRLWNYHVDKITFSKPKEFSTARRNAKRYTGIVHKAMATKHGSPVTSIHFCLGFEFFLRVRYRETVKEISLCPA